jgi:hypothetical protein
MRNQRSSNNVEFNLEIIFVVDENKFVLSVQKTDNVLRNWQALAKALQFCL